MVWSPVVAPMTTNSPVSNTSVPVRIAATRLMRLRRVRRVRGFAVVGGAAITVALFMSYSSSAIGGYKWLFIRVVVELGTERPLFPDDQGEGERVALGGLVDGEDIQLAEQGVRLTGRRVGREADRDVVARLQIELDPDFVSGRHGFE